MNGQYMVVTQNLRIVKSRVSYLAVLLFFLLLSFSGVAQSPGTAGSISGRTTVCQGELNVSYTVPGISNAASYIWQVSPGISIVNSTDNTLIVNFSISASSEFISVKGHNTNGDGTISITNITANPIPQAAGAITGLTSVCQSATSVNYSISAILYATRYKWTVPTGATYTEFPTPTPNITVDFSNAISGDVSVYGINDCGNGTSSSSTVNVIGLCDPAGIITGSNSTVCPGSTYGPYSIVAIPNATSYIWSYSGSGATFSNPTSNSTNIIFAANSISGVLSVRGTNSCGNGTSANYAITVRQFPQPAGAITGTAHVCPGQQGVQFSVAAIPNATSYTWDFTGTFGTIINNGSNNVQLNLTNSATSGYVTVKGTNSCGNGSVANYYVYVDPVPVAPVPFAGASNTICEGTFSYNITDASATGASSVHWTRSGSGLLINETTLTPTYYPSVEDVATGSVVLTLTATAVSPCTNAVSSSQTLTIQSKPIVDAGADNVICQDEIFTTRGASASNAVTTVWSKPSGSDGTFPSGTNLPEALFKPGPNDIANGGVTLTLTATGINPCNNVVYDSFYLKIVPFASANAGVDKSFCANETFTVSDATALNYSSLKWTSSGSGILSNPNTLTPSYIPSTADIALGSVTLTLHVKPNAPCALDVLDTKLLTIEPMADVDAGADASVCENLTYTVPALHTTVHYYSSILWTTSGTGTFSSGENGLTPTYNPSSDDIASGSVRLIATVKSSSSSCNNASVSDYMVLNIIRLPVVNAGSDATTCGNSGYKITQATQANAASVVWTSSGNGIFSNINSLSTTYTPSASDIAAGSVDLTLTGISANPLCSSNPHSSFTLNIVSPPTANAGTDATICENGSYTIPVNHSTVTHQSAIDWTSSGTGTLTGGGTLTPIYIPSAADIILGSVTFTLTAISTTPCSNASDQMTLTILPKPLISAGPDANACSGTNYSITASTAQNSASVRWSGGSGTFSNPDILHPVYVPGPGETGPVLLTLTAQSNSPCAVPITDSFILTYVNPASVDAGINATICQPNSFTITGSSAVNALNLNWTTSGTGIFSSTSSLTPTYQPSAADYIAGSVTLTVQADGVSPCTVPVTDSMVLTLKSLPTVNAGQDVTICKGGSYTVSGASVLRAASYSWTASGSGSLTINPSNLLSPTYVADSGETGTITLTLTAVSNTPCAATVTDQMIITIQSPPTANAGLDATACEGESFTLNGLVTNNSSFAWSATGSGTFTGASTLTPSYIPSAADAIAGSIRITLTAAAKSPCASNFSDEMTLTVFPRPVVNAGLDATICASEQYDFSLADTPLAMVSQTSSSSWSTSGDGTFSNIGSLRPIYTPGTSDIANGQVRLTLTGQPKTNCSTPVSDFIILTIIGLPTADAGPASKSICKEGITLSVASATNYSSIGWVSSGTAGTLTNINTLSPTYVPSADDIAAGSVTLTMTVNGITRCSGQATDQIILTIQPVKPVISVLSGTTTFCEGGSVTLTGATAGYNYSWTPGGAATQNNVVTASGSYRLVITDPVTGCSSLPSDAIPVTVFEAPLPPTSIGYINQCWNGVGSPATLDARNITFVPPTATMSWYDVPTGGVVRALPPTLSTVGTVTYFAEAVDNSTPNNCLSLTRTAVTLTISTIPATPVKGTDVSSDLTICETSPITSLTAGNLIAPPAGTTIVWYTSATGGSPVSPTLGSVGTKTFYAEANNGTCASATRSSGVVLTIIAAPVAPVSGGNITECVTSPVQTLTATATVTSGITLRWWTAPTGGTQVILPDLPTLSAQGTITYYAESVNTLTNCTSLTRTAVTLSLVIHPAPPVADPDIVECQKSPLQVLTAKATVPTGSTVKWYTAAAGGPPVSPILNAIGTLSYFAETDNGYCTSLTRTPVVLTINPAPAAPVFSEAEKMKCYDGLSISVPVLANVAWFESSTGGDALSTLPSLTQPESKTFYAEAISTTGLLCHSLTRTSYKLTINATPADPISGGDQRICAGATIPTLTATATSPDGFPVKFYRNSTGGTEINPPTLNAIVIGGIDYWAEVDNGICKSKNRTKVHLQIDPAPASPVSKAPLTLCANDPLMVNGDFNSRITPPPGNYTVEWFNGLNDPNPLDDVPTFGELNTGPTTFYAGFKDLTTGCQSQVRTAVTVTINPIPDDPTGIDIIECLAKPTQVLTAKVDAPASGVTTIWYNAATLGSVVSSPTWNTIGGPKSYWAQAKLGTCFSQNRKEIKLTIQNAPAAPVYKGDLNVCELIPFVPADAKHAIDSISGTTIKWFDLPTSGFEISPYLDQVATKVVYAEARSSNNCPSLTRTKVTMKMTAAPPAPVSLGDIVKCVEISIQTLNANTAITPVAGMKLIWRDRTGALITNPILDKVDTVTYFATYQEQSLLLCESARTPVKLAISAPPVAKAFANSYVGLGQTIHLNGNPKITGYTYLWTAPNGTTYTPTDGNVDISNAIASDGGWYKLTVTNTIPNCSSTDSIKVVVMAASAGAQKVCMGGTLVLIGQPDGMSSYSWTGPNKDGPDGYSSSSQSPFRDNMTAVDAGIYTLTTTDKQGNQSTSYVPVTITPLPAVFAKANSLVCQTGSLQLEGGPDGMYSYSWIGPNYKSTDQKPIPFNSPIRGDYVLTVVDIAVNGCAASDTVKVEILKPNISYDPLCLGATLHLRGEPNGMKVYKWTYPNGSTSNLQFPSISNITAANLGTYTLEVTDQTGCTPPPVTRVVTMSNPPKPMIAATPNPACEGGSVTLTSSTTGAYQYAWTGPDGYVSSVQNPTEIVGLKAINAGYYTLKLTNADQCTNADSVKLDITAVKFGGTYGPYCKDDYKVAISVTPAGVTLKGPGIGGGNGTTWTFDPVLAGIGKHNINYSYSNGLGCDIVSAYEIVVVGNPTVVTKTVYLTSCSSSATGDLTPPSVTFGSTAGLTYSYWTDALATTAVPNPKAVGAGLYYIKGATQSGKCFDIQPVMVMQPPDFLQATLKQVAALNCPGDTTGRLAVIVTKGTMPYTYDWGPQLPVQKTDTARNLPAGLYTVVITDANGCTGSFNSEIKEPPPIKLGFSVKPVQCMSDANGSASVDTINGSTDVAILNSYKYRWSTNPVQTTREALRLTPLWHKITVTDPTKGCVKKDSVFISVTDTMRPTITCPKDINITVAYLKTSDFDPNKYIVDLGKPLFWDNCTVIDTMVLNDAPLKFRTGETLVKWTVTDQMGLINSCIQKVYVKEIPAIPQMISPNGDGLNDLFIIEGLTAKEYFGSQLFIFTRSGQLVFQSNNYEDQANAWDGKYTESTFSKNQLVAPGVYYYILKLGTNNQNNKVTSSQTLKGYVYVYY